jgi:hypothetical protein
MVHLLILLLSATISSYLWSSENLINSIKRVGNKAEGNENVIREWHAVKQISASNIPELLLGMNQANDLGDNWFRAAIFEILDNSEKNSLPEDDIVKIIKDLENQGSTRSTAFYFLNLKVPQVAQSLIPSFIDDPEPGLRRKGVQLLLNQASSLEKKEQSIEAFEYALGKARDVDQIENACQSLEELGKSIDLPKVMGFITKWKVIGPFDNTARNGFAKNYSPENETDPQEKDHKGKSGLIKWKNFSTSDRLGLLDLNQQFGHIKEVLCYAHSEFNASKEKIVQFRIGSKNAWKLWVNNELLFARDEYHRGSTRVDQFILDGRLKKGTNKIMVKICQNEQTESWTKQWEFCFRITDTSGTPLLSTKSSNENK